MTFSSVDMAVLGMLCTGTLYLINLMLIFILKRFKLAIREFGIFYNLWFSIFERTIDGTTFILGWFPFGGYIKPYFESSNSIDQKNSDVLNEPNDKEKNAIFWAGWASVFVYCLVGMTSFLIVSDYSFKANDVRTFFDFLSVILKAISTFVSYKNLLLASANEFSFEVISPGFAVAVICAVSAVFKTLENLISYLYKVKSHCSKMAMVATFCVHVIYFFGGGRFLVSIFSFSDILLMAIPFLIVHFLTGTVLFFLTMKLTNGNL